VKRLSLTALNELIEFRTSIGIISSVCVGTAYSYHRSSSFSLPFFIAMVIASIMLDGAATVFNNYFDYKKAKTKEGYLYNVHNPIVSRKIPPFVAFLIGCTLIFIASILGLYLIISTHWILLILGGISILISYFYSGGKYPISYTPFGEPVSGFFEGTIVIGITYFIQTLSYSWDVFLISIPIALSISNIMLANNICDVEEDKKNGRKTLPIVIGKDKSIILLIISNIIMFLLNMIFIYLGYFPLAMLFILIIAPMVVININKFNKLRNKAQGFKYILKNSILFNFIEGILLFLASFNFLG